MEPDDHGRPATTGPALDLSDLHDGTDVATTTERAVAAAVREVEGAEAAALSVVHRDGRVDVLAATSESAAHAEQVQRRAGQSPWLSASGDALVVRVVDVVRDRRWPAWSRLMGEESGYRSLLVHRLFTTHDQVGALTLYATRPHGFDEEDVSRAEAVATHVVVAVRSVREIEGLRAALDHRTVIARATGIVMERFGLGAEDASAVLTRLSSHGNRRVLDLAVEITETGTTAGLDAAPRHR